MRVYNAIVRLNAKLENEVFKTNITAPELLILRKIHGEDAVVKIEDAGEWEDHYGKRIVPNEEGTGHEEIEVEFDDKEERERLITAYGHSLAKGEEQAHDAIHRMFGEYGSLIDELPEFKKARKEAAKASKKKDNLDRVA